MQEEIFVQADDIFQYRPFIRNLALAISVYLFLGGLAAGILFFAAIVTILGKDKEYPAAVKYAVYGPPIALSFGLLALVYDLTHPLYTWQLYTTIRIESPMSWGAWVLLIITPIIIFWDF
jgi:protein NrfD